MNTRNLSEADLVRIENRRRQVAANILAGLNYRDIAEALGVSLGLVAEDVKVIHQRWREENTQLRQEKIDLEERRLDRALNAVWNDVLSGKHDAIETFRKLSERRAKLLGLDAPSSYTFANMSDDQLHSLVAGLLGPGASAPAADPRPDASGGGPGDAEAGADP
jgi:hypothetical protein